jgi:hypothetical protein
LVGKLDTVHIAWPAQDFAYNSGSRLVGEEPDAHDGDVLARVEFSSQRDCCAMPADVECFSLFGKLLTVLSLA